MSDEITNKEQDVAAEVTEVAAENVTAEASVDAPVADLTNEPREARRGARERNPNRDRGNSRDAEKSQFLERVVTINRVSKVVKGDPSKPCSSAVTARNTMERFGGVGSALKARAMARIALTPEALSTAPL